MTSNSGTEVSKPATARICVVIQVCCIYFYIRHLLSRYKQNQIHVPANFNSPAGVSTFMNKNSHVGGL